MKSTYFFRDRPLFGLDIGTGTMRLFQVDHKGQDLVVTAYGAANFDVNHTKNGVITEPQAVANSYRQMLTSNTRGKVSTTRVAMSLPAKRTYSRAISLPKLAPKQLESAIYLEAEQYIPFSINSLYLDYTVINQTESEIEVFMVATPKTIIDSYLELAKILKIEPVLIETSIDAAARLFSKTDFGDQPSVLVDFGQESVDITIVDKTIIATGTVGGGSNDFTSKISQQLGVSHQEAHHIKNTYGLQASNKQDAITMALNPQLELLYKEIRRMIRYYSERSNGSKQIKQIVIMGNGASLPGLASKMTEVLRLPVQLSDPWQIFKYSRGLSPIPSQAEGSFITSAGLAIAPIRSLLK